MNRILALSIAAALGIALVLQGAEAADKPKPKPKPSTGSANDSYLALGDSIPFGKGKGANVKAKGGHKAVEEGGNNAFTHRRPGTTKVQRK